jgi:two-component system chemotaxis response regulator CheB
MSSTFPSNIHASDGDQRTEIICPNCGGAIRLRAEGPRDVLAFKCRVGHLYSLDELLFAKEENIESTMWTAVYVYDELAGILRDLAGRRGRDGTISEEDRTERLQQAERMASRLRQLIEEDQRINLRRAAHESEPSR